MSNFNDLVSSNPTLRERFDRMSVEIIGQIKERFGVDVTALQVSELQALKFAVLGNTTEHLNISDDEAGTLKLVKQAQEQTRMRDALNDAGGDPVAHTAMVERLAAMKPPEKLAYIRANNLTEVAQVQQKANYSDSERAELVRQSENMHGGVRIAFARKHGLDH